MRGADAVIHVAGIVPGRHPRVRAAGHVRGQRRRDPARPRRRRSPPAIAADRLRSRRSRSSATPTAGSSTRRYRRDLARRFPQLLRRDQVPRPRRGRGSASRPAPRSSSSSPATRLRARRPSGDRRAAPGGRTTARCGTSRFGETRDLADLRRRRRRRHHRGARSRPDRRGVRHGRREHGACARRCGSRPRRPGGNAAAPEHPDGGPAGSGRDWLRTPAGMPASRPTCARSCGPRPASPSGRAAPRPRRSSATPRATSTGARDAFGPATTTVSPPSGGS